MKKSFLLMSVIAFFALVGCRPKPAETIENLKAGIKGEKTASAKYKAFAEKARAEKHDTIAKLFDVIAAAEDIHATNELKALEKYGGATENFKPEYDVQGTAENLQNSIDGESYEAGDMYPQFIRKAQFESAEDAEKAFSWALNTEIKHRDLFIKALNTLNNKKESQLPWIYYICPGCGATYDKAPASAACEFCSEPKEKVIKK